MRENPEVAINVAGLGKTFGEIHALDDLDLTIQAGTVFGLLGPNGAGKTTLVRVLATLLAPTTGRAEILGHDVVREPLAVRRRIGLAGQFAAVDGELTGRENVDMIARLYRMSPRDAARRASEVLERFGLSDAADRRVATYSGGMRRRLDLAAGLIGRPPVVLLDEPTTGLDPRSRQELWAVVDELRRDGTTVLLTTQYLDEADQLAQRIAVVDHGRIAAEGTPAELKAAIGGNVLSVRVVDPSTLAEAAATLAGLGRGEPPLRRRRRRRDPACGVRSGSVRRGGPAARRAARSRSPRSNCSNRASTTSSWPSPGGPPRPDPRSAPTRHEHRLRGAAGSMSTIPITIADSPRLTLGETIADSRVMATRQLRKILRRPMFVVYLFVQPVIFVLLFRYVFGGAINTGRISYVNYLLPGIIVMTAVFGALTTGLGLTEDLAAGVIDRFRSLPIAQSAVLVGRTAADLVTNFVTLLVMLLIGVRRRLPAERVGPGDRARVRARARLRVRVLVDQRVSSGSWCAIRRPRSRSASSGCSRSCSRRRRSCRRPHARRAQAFADVNPVTLVVNAARALTIGHGRRAGAGARHAGVARRAAARVRAAVGARVSSRIARGSVRA